MSARIIWLAVAVTIAAAANPLAEGSVTGAGAVSAASPTSEAPLAAFGAEAGQGARVGARAWIDDRASSPGPFFSGPARIGGRKAVYLTFDDGPDGAGTRAVLSALRSQRIKATFFALGSRAATADGQRTLRALSAAGMPVGMHSWSHSTMSRWSSAAVRQDFSRTSSVIRRATGLVPTCFRPPYGAVGSGMLAAARSRRIQIALWDVDPRDWASPGASAIASRVVSNLHPGAVVVMHDGAGHGRQAAAAIPRIVRAARAKRYVFGTLCPMKEPRSRASAA